MNVLPPFDHQPVVAFVRGRMSRQMECEMRHGFYHQNITLHSLHIPGHACTECRWSFTNLHEWSWEVQLFWVLQTGIRMELFARMVGFSLYEISNWRKDLIDGYIRWHVSSAGTFWRGLIYVYQFIPGLIRSIVLAPLEVLANPEGSRLVVVSC